MKLVSFKVFMRVVLFLMVFVFLIFYLLIILFFLVMPLESRFFLLGWF